MRISASLAVVFVLLGCTHAPAEPDDSADAWAAVGRTLAAMPVCVGIARDGFETTETDIMIRPSVAPNGQPRFRRDVRTAFDAFAAIGFLNPVEQRDASGRVIAQRYNVTAAGAPLYRAQYLEPPSRPNAGFCTGRRVIVERLALTPVRTGACGSHRAARFTWRYEGLGEWLDAAPIAAAFPDRIGTAERAAVREDSLTLLLTTAGWQRGTFDLHLSCMPSNVDND